MIWVDERIFVAWKYVHCITMWSIEIEKNCMQGFKNGTKTLNVIKTAFIVYRLIDWHLDVINFVFDLNEDVFAYFK